MHPRRILLIGANGQLGFELRRELSTLGRVVAPARDRVDLADIDSVRRVIREERPVVIVNAAAYTAVDLAEEQAEQCAVINAVAPGVIAEEASSLDATLIHFSTDFVFDGRGSEPYDERAPTAPLNVYGSTKLAGEQAVLATGAEAFVFRIGWVYGLYRSNFLNTIRRLAADRDVLTVVADQVGVPTWTGSVATAVGQIVAQVQSVAWSAGEHRAPPGVYHMAGSGRASWAELAAEVLLRHPVPGREHVVVKPITTAEFPRPAVRPHYSVMASNKLAEAFGVRLPDWREQLELCLRPVSLTS